MYSKKLLAPSPRVGSDTLARLGERVSVLVPQWVKNYNLLRARCKLCLKRDKIRSAKLALLVVRGLLLAQYINNSL